MKLQLKLTIFRFIASWKPVHCGYAVCFPRRLIYNNKQGFNSYIGGKVFLTVIFQVNVGMWQHGLMTFDLSQPLRASKAPVGSSLGWLMARRTNKSVCRCVYGSKISSKNIKDFPLVLECLEYPGEYSSQGKGGQACVKVALLWQSEGRSFYFTSAL